MFIENISSMLRPFGIVCVAYGGVATLGDRLNCRLGCAVLRIQARVKTDMRQNTASQNLCDGWAKYRQNAYVS